MTVADLILLWQKGKEMHGVGEKDTSVAIFTLLCSTIQHQSGPLLKAMIGMIHKDVFPPHTDPTNSFKDNVGYNAVVAMLSLIRNNWTLVREIGLYDTWWWYSLCTLQYRPHYEHTGSDHFDCGMYTNMYFFMFILWWKYNDEYDQD